MTDTWTTLDEANASDSIHQAQLQRRSAAEKDQAYDRLMAATLAWRGGWKRLCDTRHDSSTYPQVSADFALLDDELQSAKLAYQPYCPHNHPIPFQTGCYHFEGGEVWDDIKDTNICADCGLDLEAK